MSTDSMRRHWMLRAATLLEAEAQGIFECHEINGEWADDAFSASAKADYVEMSNIARSLRELAP